MKQNPFYDMFLDLLKDIFDAENQIVENCPKIIQAASQPELKEALTEHLDETKNQVQRLKKIFKILNENPTGKRCMAMQGLFAEADEAVNKQQPPLVKDACLIICMQKVEHYEIASYGSACALVRHLDIDSDEIADVLQQSLDEESAADEKLTYIAEGGFLSEGINDEAEKEQTQTDRSHKQTY